MKKLVATIALAVSTMLAVPAMAQTQRKPRPVKVKSIKSPKERAQDMKFEPMGIEGGLAGPDGEAISGDHQRKQPGFDLLRHTFYDKLVRSTENL